MCDTTTYKNKQGKRTREGARRGLQKVVSVGQTQYRGTKRGETYPTREEADHQTTKPKEQIQKILPKQIKPRDKQRDNCKSPLETAFNHIGKNAWISFKTPTRGKKVINHKYLGQIYIGKSLLSLIGAICAR